MDLWWIEAVVHASTLLKGAWGHAHSQEFSDFGHQRLNLRGKISPFLLTIGKTFEGEAEVLGGSPLPPPSRLNPNYGGEDCVHYSGRSELTLACVCIPCYECYGPLYANVHTCV